MHRCLLALFLFFLSNFCSHPPLLAQQKQDQPEGPALAPAEALKLLESANGLKVSELLAEPTVRQPLFTTFDFDGRMWVVQYLQYPEPAGIRQLSRDNYWRIVYDRLPKPPGQDVPGADRITIFSQDNGEAKYVEVGDFVSGLNMATSVVPTTRGAWILQPPYLLYYHDENGDLHADGPPEVHLQGFGLEDTHSIVNSLCMGPDGWLYAAQGSTVTAAVKNYGSSAPPQKSLGQLIWRYHPELRKYEVFAEGGGNAFGVAFDDHGQVFSGHNGGDTRGFHYVQGGYFRKGFSKHGSLSNPYTFGYLMPMEHDPVQRFTHTMLATTGTSLQSYMPDSLLCVDPLHGTLVNTKLIPIDSTYKTEDIELALKTKDKWFRPVAIADGPDGAAYISDWYDSQVAHLYAHVGKLDRDHGRVYRLAGSTEASPWEPATARGTDAPSLKWLLERLRHPYRWQRWHAQILIAEHPLRDSARVELKGMLSEGGQVALEALWTAHLCGWIEDTIPWRESQGEPLVDFATLIKHPSADVRSWSVRLVCDDEVVSDATFSKLLELAGREQNPHVLSQIACSAKRLPSDQAIQWVARLLNRDLPNDELHLPHLIWWAVEMHAEAFASVDAHLLKDQPAWSNELFQTQIAPKLVKRWAMSGKTTSMEQLAHLFDLVKRLPKEVQSSAVPHLTKGFEEAFEGRTLAAVPNSVLDRLIDLGQPSLALRLRRGDAKAFAEAMAAITNTKTPSATRVQLLQILAQVHPQEAKLSEQLTTAVLQVVAKDKSVAVKTAAIASLAPVHTDIAKPLIEIWSELPSDARTAVGALLASRLAWTSAWIDAVESHRVGSGDIPLEVVRSMRLHSDTGLLERLAKLYPTTGAVDLPKAKKEVERITAIINSGNGDPYAGKKLFNESCGRCHSLFESGGQIGPNLTGYQRDQLATLALNTVGPNLEVREGYQSFAILTEADLMLTGFIEQETAEQVTLRSVDGLAHTLARDDIKIMKPQPQSLMPEGLLDKLSEQQTRDLFAYLRSSQPLNDGT